MRSFADLHRRLKKLEPGKPFVFMFYAASDGLQRVFCGDGQGICTGSVVAPELITDLDHSVFDMGPESELLRARLRSGLLVVPRGITLDHYQQQLHTEAIVEARRRSALGCHSESGDPL